ncbi:TraB/GumN family protein [Brevundimonas kwangchunensis]|uniref:TraB/GumN family protein n=1 Tax=Brevundimonas kwangchunensis TaxID=322163 RepID=A0ABP3SA82_9CAUL
MTTFARRLTRTAADVGRTALGTVLGLTLAGAIAFQPAQAFAQNAAAPAVREVPRAEGAGPALWVIRDADSTIYLFGTVHVLRPTTAWGSEVVDRAFDSADQIWFEISNPDDSSAMMPLIQQHGISPQRPLSSLLTAAEMTELNAAAGAMGMQAAQVDMLRPWFAALTLSIAPLVKAGYDPQSGVELVLKGRAEAAGKPINGFETIDEQVRILAGLPEEEQLAFLRSTLETYDNAHEEIDGMVAAWASGDTTALKEQSVDKLKEDSQVVYDALLTNRNANWAGQIQEMLAGSGTAFIAVGAAHLVGDESVQSILAQRGVTAERVE